jgi:hypothetical protein
MSEITAKTAVCEPLNKPQSANKSIPIRLISQTGIIVTILNSNSISRCIKLVGASHLIQLSDLENEPQFQKHSGTPINVKVIRQRSQNCLELQQRTDIQ